MSPRIYEVSVPITPLSAEKHKFDAVSKFDFDQLKDRYDVAVQGWRFALDEKTKLKELIEQVAKANCLCYNLAGLPKNVCKAHKIIRRLQP